MSRILFVAVVLTVVVNFSVLSANVTPSVQCPGEEFEDLRDRIEVIPCGKTRCKLRKGTNTTVNFRFNPKNEVKDLTNDVRAEVAGVPLPFIGIHGVSACKNIKHADSGEPAPCPLAPNKEYVYTNVFPIHNFYPSVQLRVHWGLNDGKQDVICFEVPAVIS